jgi:hypothetical protein
VEQGGIISGMKSEGKPYPDAEEVLTDIGEKAARAFALSVQRAKRDLLTYRQTFPQWVADHSERGLANWINDRIWAHLRVLAEDVSTMTATEKGPLREMTVGLNHRFRVKRHDEEGNVASFPTPSFLEFASQPVTQLPGMEEIRLIAGYDWNKDRRDMGAAVISLRDGKDNVIWKEPLAEIKDEEGGGTAPVVVPEQPGPTSPTIEVPEGIGQKSEESTEDE